MQFRKSSTFALLLALSPAPAHAQRVEAAEAPREAAAPRPKTYTLKECLDLADHNHPNILAAMSRVDSYRAQLEEAHFAPYSQFNLTGGVGPAPTFRGNDIYSPDKFVGLSSNFGMAWRIGVDGTVPIWTFGKITNTWRAAEAQIDVGEADVKRARNAVRTDVRRAYYGLELARDAIALLADAGGKLDDALKRLEKKVKDEEADDLDLLRLRTARSELDGRLAEAQSREKTALAALRFYTGIQEGFDIPNEPLRPPKRSLAELRTYIDAAKSYRPEILMARAGVRAREAQVELARSKMMPDIGVSLFWSYARAPEITDQFNPFVRDDANYLYYGFGVGLRWTLDFLPANARVKEARAQLEETRQLLRFATEGVAADVEKAFEEAVEAKKKVDAYQKASKYARQWMIKVSQGIDVGTMEERDLVDPARQYALQRFNYLQALLDYNMAMANLAEKTGWDIVAEPLE